VKKREKEKIRRSGGWKQREKEIYRGKRKSERDTERVGERVKEKERVKE